MSIQNSALRLLLVSGDELNGPSLEQSCERCGIVCTATEIDDLQQLNTELTNNATGYDLVVMDGHSASIRPERVTQAIGAQGASLPVAILAEDDADDATLQRFGALGAFVLMKRRNHRRLLPFGLRAIVSSGVRAPSRPEPMASSERRREQERLVEQILSNWEEQRTTDDKRYACSSLQAHRRSERTTPAKVVLFPTREVRSL